MILSPVSVPSVAVASWLWAIVAALAYAAGALRSSEPRPWPAYALGLGWLAHAVAIVVSLGDIGSAPGGLRFGFAAALSVTAWIVIGVHAVESRFVPLPAVHRVLAAVGVLAVALAAWLPGDVHGTGTSPWLPVHWLLGMASYGMFAAAVLHAALLDASERRMRLRSGAWAPPTMPLMRLERLTFRFVEAGFAVLSATLVLGAWSESSWRWDHKTVFSLLAWATLAALLIGRHLRGWRGRLATRWLYAGAGLLLLAYVGTRFVLEVILHRSGAMA